MKKLEHTIQTLRRKLISQYSLMDSWFDAGLCGLPDDFSHIVDLLQMTLEEVAALTGMEEAEVDSEFFPTCARLPGCHSLCTPVGHHHTALLRWKLRQQLNDVLISLEILSEESEQDLSHIHAAVDRIRLFIDEKCERPLASY